MDDDDCYIEDDYIAGDYIETCAPGDAVICTFSGEIQIEVVVTGEVGC